MGRNEEQLVQCCLKGKEAKTFDSPPEGIEPAFHPVSCGRLPPPRVSFITALDIVHQRPDMFTNAQYDTIELITIGSTLVLQLFELLEELFDGVEFLFALKNKKYESR